MQYHRCVYQSLNTVIVVVCYQGNRIQLKWVNDKVTDSSEMNRMETAVRSAQTARIVEVREERKIVKKPLGLNTVALLKACSKGMVSTALQCQCQLKYKGFFWCCSPPWMLTDLATLLDV